MRAALLALAVVFAGCARCAPPPADVDVRLRVDSTVDVFGYSGEDLVADLLDSSEIFAPLGARLLIDDGAEAAVRCATWPMGTAAATTNASGISVACLYVANLYPRAARLHLLAHELGHAMGLDHVEDPGALMYYEVGREARLALTVEDLVEWERVHGGAQ